MSGSWMCFNGKLGQWKTFSHEAASLPYWIWQFVQDDSMEIKLGFVLFAYYTWWIIILACLAIALFKLLTNQNISVAFRIGIPSGSRTDRDSYTFEPILMRHNQANLTQQNNNNGADNGADQDNQVEDDSH